MPSEHKPCSSEDRYLGIKARDTFRQGLGKERGTNTKVEKQNTKGGNIGTMRIHLRMTELKKVRNSFSSYCDTVEISKYHQIICCIMTTSVRSPKLPIVKTKCPLPCTLWIHKCWLLIYMTKFTCHVGTLSQVMPCVVSPLSPSLISTVFAVIKHSMMTTELSRADE